MITILALILLSQTGECLSAHALEAPDPAPCTGVLWPASFTADAIEAIEVTLPGCRVKLDSAKHELKICDETVTKVRQECDVTINRLALLTKKAARIERPWWDNNTLWGGAGFVAGTVIAVLIINAAGEPF
jgi:predicted phage tail protein